MAYAIVIIAILLVLYIVILYNRLVTLKTRSEEAWSDIDVQLKRRHDLIPNLVETVKGYAKHEKDLFQKVADDRAAALGATNISDQVKSENALTQSLKSVFAIAENYPELKASTNFAKLQDELTDTENKLEAARRFYNANVRDLNISVASFPSNVIANIFKFNSKQLFDVPEAEAVPVDVKF